MWTHFKQNKYVNEIELIFKAWIECCYIQNGVENRISVHLVFILVALNLRRLIRSEVKDVR